MVIGFSSGEIVVRAPYEAGNVELLKFQTGFSNLIDLAGPYSANTDD